MIKGASFLIAIFVLSACGSLEVRMDVLDPTYVKYARQEIELRETLRLILEKPDNYVRQQLTDLQRHELGTYSQIAEAYRGRADDSSIGETQQSLLVSAANILTNNEQTQEVRARYQQAMEKVETLRAQIEEVLENLDPNVVGRMLQGSKNMDPGLVGLIVRRNEAIRSLTARVDTELQGASARNSELIGSAPPTKVESDIKAARAGVAMTVDELVWGTSLHDDSAAYAVANAPEAKWGLEYNRAYGRGKAGNFDIAIKLARKGDFTIKGMTFDPSKIAQVASKAATQAVLLAARIYGVPVPTGAGAEAGGGDTGVQLSDDQQLVAAEEAIKEKQKLKEEFNDALLLIARSIIDESKALDDPEIAKRKSAVEAISATYVSHKSRLSISIAEPD